MNAPDPTASPGIVHGHVDAKGRLHSADPVLVRLNERAGGAIDLPIAIPQLATIARLARRLGIIVSRSARVADGDVDLDLWVRAQPEGDDVRLSIGGWTERQPRGAPAGERAEADFLGADAEWRWETDAALRLTFISLAAGRALGFDAIGLLGAPITALFLLDGHADGAAPLIEALADRKPLDRQPARLRINGAPVILSAMVRRDSAGGFAGFSGAARSEDAPAGPVVPDEPLSSDFTGGLDSALRRPLARIIANADSIHAQIEGPVGDSYADYAADIASAARHLLGLVDDLADLTAVEGDQFALPRESIDLADIARRAAGLLAVRAADAGVTIRRPGPAQVVAAQGDFRRTLQILVNLVGNAIRYAPRGSAIDVAAGIAGEIAGVTVADRGKGIAPRDQERVFAKFGRVDESEAGGNGLGLYISRRLARAMGGDLTLASTPGEGARFTLTLASKAATAKAG